MHVHRPRPLRTLAVIAVALATSACGGSGTNPSSPSPATGTNGTSTSPAGAASPANSSPPQTSSDVPTVAGGSLDSDAFCTLLLAKLPVAMDLSESAILDEDKDKASQLKQLNHDIAEAAPAEIHEAFATMLTLTDAMVDTVITGTTPSPPSVPYLQQPEIKKAVAEQKAWVHKNCPRAEEWLSTTPGN